MLPNAAAVFQRFPGLSLPFTRLQAPRAASPAADSGAPAKQQSQQQTGGGDSLTLAGRGSSDHVSCEEEGGQQATSALKPANAARAAAGDAPAQKRSLGGAPAFSFPAPAAPEPAGDDAAAKKRRVQYDHGRMREMEAEVQRLRHLGDALKQSLLQAQAQVCLRLWAGLQPGAAAGLGWVAASCRARMPLSCL